MCRPDGTWSTTCEAQVTPVAEVLCNGLDDDCDGDVDEGDVLRCGMGACARTAPACTDGRSSQCLPGAPAPERCDGIDEDCDGVGDDDDPDATAACASTREDRLDGRCMSGRCEEVACPRGFANCDGSSANGCERDVRYDFQNCGGCGVRAGDGEVCFDGIHGTIDQVSSTWGETCAIINPGGRVACWGQHHGAWGHPEGGRNPEALLGIEDAVTVRTGTGEYGSHGCAITERSGARRLHCWGLITSYAPGRGGATGAELAVPVEFPSLRGLRDVAVGQRLACALTAGGYLWCVGEGYTPTPPLIRSADGARLVAGITDVHEVVSDMSEGGGSYMCARSGDGLVRCYGEQLPWYEPYSYPAPLPGLTGVTWVRSAGRSICFGHADRPLECASSLGLILVRDPIPMNPSSFFARAMPRSGPREAAVYNYFTCSLEPRDGTFERCWGESGMLQPIPGDAPYQRVELGIPAALGTVGRGEVELVGAGSSLCVFRRGAGHLLCRGPARSRGDGMPGHNDRFVPVLGSRPLPP